MVAMGRNLPTATAGQEQTVRGIDEVRKMEEPVRVQLWAKIAPTMREEGLKLIRAQGVFASEIELRKAVMESVRDRRPMQVSLGLGYQNARQLASSNRAIFEEVTYCQEGYSPSAAYCSDHNFHYGGIFGCHLCSGFYEK
jgi:hypothetical protein